MSEEVSITGIEEACAMLDRVPKETVKVAFARSLAAAAVPIVQALRSRMRSRNDLFDPESFSSITGTAETGSLRNNLRTQVEIDAGGQGGFASINFGKAGHIANWLEYGHRMFTHFERASYNQKMKRKRLAGGHKQVGDVRAYPFMRPSAQEASDASVEAFAETLTETLVTGTTWASVGESAA